MVEFEVNLDWGRGLWIGAGVVLGLVILYVLHSFVGTFVFGLFIYYSTRRVNGHVRERVGNRSLSAGLSLTLLALPAVLLLYYTVAIALQELRQFAQNSDLQPYLQVAQSFLDVSQIVQEPERLLEDAGGIELLRSMAVQALDYVGFIGTGLLHLFVMFALAFYLLRDGPKVAAWIDGFEEIGPTAEAYFSAVDDSLEKIFAGNILNAVVTGIVGALTYSLLNAVAPPAVSIPYPALVGLLAGIASLVPVVGMKLVYVPVTAYLAVQGYTAGTGWGFVALFFGVSFVVVDAIPDFLVRPYVAGGSLHVGTVMFAYILGPLLFGWYGIFLGPIILALVTHFLRIVLPELLTGVPARPAGVDPTYLPHPDRPEAALEGSEVERESPGGEGGSESTQQSRGGDGS